MIPRKGEESWKGLRWGWKGLRGNWEGLQGSWKGLRSSWNVLRELVGPQGPRPQGRGSFLGPLRLGILHYAAHLPLRGFATNFEPSISRILGFMA